jgi:dolichol kinase
MRTTLWRKLWHVLGGCLFPVLAFFLPQGWLLALLGLAAAILVAWEVLRFTSARFGGWMQAHLQWVLKTQEQYRPTGTTYLVLASLLAFVAFDKYVAIASLFFLALGDPAAALVGKRLGHWRLAGKSLVGSLACLAACVVVGLLMLQTGGGLTLPVVLAGAAAAAVVEFLPLPLDDNLTIPVGSALVMALAALL